MDAKGSIKQQQDRLFGICNSVTVWVVDTQSGGRKEGKGLFSSDPTMQMRVVTVVVVLFKRAALRLTMQYRIASIGHSTTSSSSASVSHCFGPPPPPPPPRSCVTYK